MAIDPGARALAVRALNARKWQAPVALMGAPRVAATPPTISVSAAATLPRPIYAASSSPPYVASQSAGSPFAVSRTIPAITTTGGVAFAAEPTVTSGTGNRNGYSLRQFSVLLDDSAIEILTQGAANRYYIKVDGEYLPDTLASPATLYHSATAANQWRKIDFGTRKVRRIDVIGGGGGADTLNFCGFAINANGAINPAPIRGPRVIIQGDSFSENTLHSWTHWFAETMGWDDVWTSGVGGTGFLANAGGGSLKFRDRLATDVAPWSPDIVIVLGGQNDLSTSAPALQVEAALYAATVRALMPNALLIGSCNSARGPESLSATALAARDAIRDGFISGGGIWLDITEQPLYGAGAHTSLLSAVAAGRAGNTGVVTTTSGATGIPCVSTAEAPASEVGLRIGSTVDIGTGATRERKVVTGIAFSGGKPVYAFDGSFQYAHAAGEPVVEVGASYISGRGHAGAVTGWGTADLWCSDDTIHPTKTDLLSAPYTNGHYAIGRMVGSMVQRHLETLDD